jgi:transcriptional regulator with XRE-family HTH domain
MSVLRKALAENMRQRRRALGLSQEELAHRAEIDRTYVSSLERRVYGATIDMVERLAGALGVEPHELLRPLEGKV